MDATRRGFVGGLGGAQPKEKDLILASGGFSFWARGGEGVVWVLLKWSVTLVQKREVWGILRKVDPHKLRENFWEWKRRPAEV